MKTTLALLTLVSSLSAFAAIDPDYCAGKDSCQVGTISAYWRNYWEARDRNSGSSLFNGAFTRGFGKTADEAMANSERRMDTIFRGLECNSTLYGSHPYNFGTTKLAPNRYVAWTVCPGGSGSVRTTPRPSCVMLFGAMVCD